MKESELIKCRLNELLNDSEVRNGVVEGYDDYIFFSTGDVYSSKSNRFLGLTRKGNKHHSLYLYDGEGRSNRLPVSRGHILGELFIPRPDERYNIVSQKVKNDDWSVDNLKWCIRAEVSRKNLLDYLNSVKAKLKEAEQKAEDKVEEKTEEVVDFKRPTPMNMWLLLFSILAVALAYKITT